MRATFAIACALLCGCRSMPFEGPGGPRAADDASAPGNDATASNACSGHARVAVPLTDLTLVDGADAPRVDAALRLHVAFQITTCDAAAGIAVKEQSSSDTDYVDVTAFAWVRGARALPDCRIQNVERVILVDGAQLPRVSARDAGPGALKLSFMLQPRPFGKCPPVAVQSTGQTCDHDCDCAGFADGARCIPTSQFGQSGHCGKPCSTDTECPDANPLCLTGGRTGASQAPPYTCDLPANGYHCDETRCPFGQHCTTVTRGDSVCRPPFNHKPVFASCQCDSDCGAGALCDGAAGRCLFPCSVAPDCPRAPSAISCVDGTCRYN